MTKYFIVGTRDNEVQHVAENGIITKTTLKKPIESHGTSRAHAIANLGIVAYTEQEWEECMKMYADRSDVEVVE